MPTRKISAFTQAKNNRVVQNSIFSSISFGIPFILMLLFTPTLIQQMGTEGYGLWSVAVSALSMMGMLEFGLGLAISKFIAEYQSIADYRGISTVVTVGIIANLLIGVILSAPLFLFAKQLSGLFQSDTISTSQIIKTLQIASFGFFPLLLRNSGLAIPEGLQNFKVSSSIRTLQSALVIIVALLVNQWGGTIEQVALSTILIMWIIGLASIGVAFLSLRQMPLIFPNLERKYVKAMFSFVTYSGLRGIGAQLFTTVDRIAVGAVLGLSNLTYYVVCIGIANKFIAFSSSLTQALVPAASSLYKGGNVAKVRQYFFRATAVVAITNLSIGLVTIWLANSLLSWWIDVDFAEKALELFRILIFIYMLLAVTAPAAQIANGIGVPWVNTIGALSGGIGTVLLIIILGRNFGLIGVGLANVAAWVRFWAPSFIYIKLQSYPKKQLEGYPKI